MDVDMHVALVSEAVDVETKGTGVHVSLDVLLPLPYAEVKVI